MRRTPDATLPSLRILKKPISPLRPTWMPPQSSEETPGTVMTRTRSPYFSPKIAIAPEATACSSDFSSLCTAWSAQTAALTSSSIVASSAAVTPVKCVKSKRRRSASTCEPACLTWSPSALRSAACSRCVAVWLRAMRRRRSASTAAPTTSPSASNPSASRPRCRT